MVRKILCCAKEALHITKKGTEWRILGQRAVQMAVKKKEACKLAKADNSLQETEEGIKWRGQ